VQNSPPDSPDQGSALDPTGGKVSRPPAEACTRALAIKAKPILFTLLQAWK